MHRLSRPPRHVPTFAARPSDLVAPRLIVALLLLALAVTGAGTMMFGGNAPPTGSSIGAPSAEPANAIPDEDDPTPAAQPAEHPTSGPSSTLQPPPTPPLKEARPTSPPPEELTGYQWPLRGARLTSRFSERSFGGFLLIDGKEIHDGIDLARFCGTKVRAAHDGTVLYAGRKFDDYIGYRGSAAGIYARLERQGGLRRLPIVVVIDDGNGYRSVYVHLDRADVEAGDVVKAGDVIGREGQTGFATGCHLHYSLIRMDGPWQEVVPQLHRYGYPPLVRERVDPLLVLPWADEHAPEKLRQRVLPPPPSPDPDASAQPTPAAEPTASTDPAPSGVPGSSPTADPSGVPAPSGSPTATGSPSPAAVPAPSAQPEP